VADGAHMPAQNSRAGMVTTLTARRRTTVRRQSGGSQKYLPPYDRENTARASAQHPCGSTMNGCLTG
jgi:hypothetical protein